jgi:methionyl-tRNA formyltransferase
MTRSKKIAVFGCKATTRFLIENLHDIFQIRDLITVDPATGAKHDVADYCDLRDWATRLGVSVYQAKQYSLKSLEDQEYINALGIDIALVMGWQRLIPNEILSRLGVGAFGMHGSSANLPLGRGRSPMNWSIIEGRRMFYTNLFKYDPGMDSGDILDTFKFQITDRDTAETMHYKNALAMRALVLRNIEKLETGTFHLTRQRTDILPTYYQKRSPQDSLIDWSNEVYSIERFIRAVTRPFNGAYSFVNNVKVLIWASQIFDHEDFGYENEKEGTIVEVFPAGKFLVRCFGGLLLVTDHESPEALRKGQRFENGNQEIKHHLRNRWGFFDLEQER